MYSTASRAHLFFRQTFSSNLSFQPPDSYLPFCCPSIAPLVHNGHVKILSGGCSLQTTHQFRANDSSKLVQTHQLDQLYRYCHLPVHRHLSIFSYASPPVNLRLGCNLLLPYRPWYHCRLSQIMGASRLQCPPASENVSRCHGRRCGARIYQVVE